MKAIRKKIIYIFPIFIALMLIMSALYGGTANYVCAATSSYSDVLDDLKRDSDFKLDDFPAYDDDYRLYVIQIGEGEHGDLFVYTYQPCQPSRAITATHINMSLTDSVDDTELYDLVLINTNGVFAKYRVKGVTVRSNTVLRYYNISSIYRAWIEGVDDPSNSDNTINEKAFPVGKLFYVMTQQDGSIVYNLDPTYVLKIIDPVSSYITVENSSTSGHMSMWNSYKKYQYTDMHYVAFSTDWDIDRLISATVHYSYCSGVFADNDFLWWDINSFTKYGDPLETNAELECTDSYNVTYKNLWSVFTLGKHTYTWDKIYTVDKFCADVAANTSYDESTLNSVRDKVSGREWVLLFATTERKQENDNTAGVIGRTTYFTKVDNVSVLRLEFESDGIVYNLGAVSDTVSTPYPEPDEPGDGRSIWQKIKDFFKGLWNKVKNIPWWQWLLIGLAAVAGISLVVSLLVFGVKAVFRGIWWVISLPFRSITTKPKNRGKKK